MHRVAASIAIAGAAAEALTVIVGRAVMIVARAATTARPASTTVARTEARAARIDRPRPSWMPDPKEPQAVEPGRRAV
jgi:hypothetical protein